MEVIATPLEGVLLIQPRVFADGRGYFFEAYSQQEFDSKVFPVRFVQDNESRSVKGVLRGLHYQKGEYSQGKLVRVVKGAVIDYAVDIRRGSPSFGKYFCAELSEENHTMLFIPRGFAHGFEVISDTAIFQYKCDRPYAPQHEGAIIWNDPDLAIRWKTAPGEAILSEKDTRNPRLRDVTDLFTYGKDLY